MEIYFISVYKTVISTYITKLNPLLRTEINKIWGTFL